MHNVAQSTAEGTHTAPASRSAESHATRLARLLDWVELATEQLASGANAMTVLWKSPDRPWNVDASLHVDVRPSQAPKLLEQRRPRKVDPELPTGFVALTKRIASVAEQARLLHNSSHHPAAFMTAHALRLVARAADSYIAARGEGLEVTAETWTYPGDEPDDEAGVSVVLTMHQVKGHTDQARAVHRALGELYEERPSAFPKHSTNESTRWLDTEIRKRAIAILDARGLNGAALWRAAHKIRARGREERGREISKVAS